MQRGKRLIFILILMGLICNAVFLFFYQINLRGNLNDEVTTSTWYNQLAFIGNFFLSIASIYSFINYRKSFPAIISGCYVLFILLIILTSIKDMDVFAKTPSLFYSPKGVGTWINFGILFFVAQERLSNKIFNLFKFLCYFFILFNVAQIALLGSVSNRDQALNAIRDTTVYLIWVYPFFFLENTAKKKFDILVKYSLIVVITFCAFAIASRSYMLILLVIILIKIRRDLGDKKNSGLAVGLIGLALFGSYFLVANIESFHTLNGFFKVFSGRIDDDTRSTQLKEFLLQFDITKIFTGVGPTGTWNWISYNKPKYEWLDNQFILITWWFGIQTTIVYLFFLCYSLFKKNVQNYLVLSNAKVVIFFWILACGGFAIYTTVSTSLFYYFISLLIGISTINRQYIQVQTITRFD